MIVKNSLKNLKNCVPYWDVLKWAIPKITLSFLFNFQEELIVYVVYVLANVNIFMYSVFVAYLIN